MRTLTAALLIVLTGLQMRLWAGDGSLAEVWRLDRAIEAQGARNQALAERNGLMLAQVADLREGLDAVEDLARRELGLIARGETFFLVVDR